MDIFKMNLKEQSKVLDEILKDRITNLLPKLMRETKTECWIVIGREYNECPILKTMLPSDFQFARRLTTFIFINKNNSLKKYTIANKYSTLRKVYECIEKEKNESEYDVIKKILKKENINTISVNISKKISLLDGLSKELYDKLKYLNVKIISAENIALRWLETRTKEELEIMRQVVLITKKIIQRTFTKEIIKENTTTDDLEWFMREEIKKIGGIHWFGPDVDFQRETIKNSRDHGLIKKGDILHCDIGITYMNYNSDIQQIGYILRETENKKIVEELNKLLKETNDFQDILLDEFKLNKTGNDIFESTIEKSKKLKCEKMIYSHPIGYHGHGAGFVIGRYDNQGFIPIIGEKKLSNNTCFAMELNISKEFKLWNNQKVYIYLEENIVFKDKKVDFLAYRQNKIIEI